MDESGRTPLHFAAISGHIRIVRYLISEIGCDPQSADKYGNFPLHFACVNGYTEIAEYLINDKQCSPNCTNEVGYTPLYCACEEGHLDLVKLLTNKHSCNPKILTDTKILHGHNIFESNVFNKIIHEKCSSCIRRTALHAACEKGHLSIVNYLISECSCDPNCRDSLGITPLGYASIFKHFDIVKYLIIDCNCDLKFGKEYIQLYTELLLHKEYLVQFNILGDRIRDFLESCNHTDLSITPMFAAAYAGDIKFLNFLVLECKLNPDSDCGHSMA